MNAFTYWTASSFGALVLSAWIPSAQAIHREIGAQDPIIKTAVDTCFASPSNSTTYGGEVGYQAGLCPNLINCIMDNISPADSAGMSAGSTIASLLPTILALVGAGPIELVQLAFASPIRAAATCLFGVGLPSGLFRQLRTSSHAPIGEFEMSESRDPVVADIIIVGLAGIMLWRNWVIGSITMVTFRCEYSWLLFCWPMACLLWLSSALLSLFFMSKEIRITLEGHKSSFGEIIMLPYRNRLPAAPVLPSRSVPVREDVPLRAPGMHPGAEEELPNQPYSRRPGTSHSNSTAVNSPPISKFRDDARVDLPLTPRTAVGIPEISFTVTIVMRKETFWQWYETGIETVAVGVYLYATIVLGSILFLTGQSSIEYVVLMVLSLAVIRIVGTVM
ncbi:hypothetical protein BT96DRAFT_1014091 [Gymnopus androsaceus JB14]|uniref:SLC26A/SulP transporter domain-containing protein n=1 Tax=Gymnopus androsaceus JB14 TaxID=1447944 RepID=A0A6A4IFW0_9AGAR|nr:hypothetical protein BT96DRAFT_1014091 [Gymnopus androsaceus JB14]